MGQLFNFLRTAVRSRRRTARQTASRRRPLAFERCEPRIALSTNDVTSASASDATLHYEAADFDAADFKLPQWQLVGDGGMIAISFQATDATNRQTIIADRFEALNPLGAGNFVIRDEAIAILTSIAADRESRGELSLKEMGITLGQRWSQTDEFNLFDSTAEGDYAMPLNDTELASGGANGDFAVIPPPTERPGLNGGSEGGQIALSPFVAPTGLTLSDGQGTSTVARTGAPGEPLGVHATPTTSDATRAEGLRGRAVVFEVADAEASAAANATNQIVDARDRSAQEIIDGLELDGGDRDDRGANDNGRQVARHAAAFRPVDAGQTAPETSVAAAAAMLTADLNLNNVAALKTPGGDFVPSLNGGDGDGRDAAFAAWLAPDSPEDMQGDELAPTAVNDRRMLSVGLVMALTFVPLRKAWRRRGAASIGTQLPPERRSATRHDG